MTDPALGNTIEWCGATNARQLLVEVGGDVIAETCWHGTDIDSTQDCASIQKGATAVVLGQLVAEGLVELSAPVSEYLGAAWTNADAELEDAVTVRHLATMSSGLDEDYGYDHPPGTHWYYNNNAYHCIRRILEIVTGLHPNELFGKRLFEPLEMTRTTWIQRPNSEDANGWPKSGLNTNTRDLARFGRAVMTRTGLGCTDDYLDAMLSPSTAMNPSYGYLWWIFGGQSAILPGNPPGRPVDPKHPFGRIELDRPIAPEAPADTIAGLGMGDQRLYLVPSADAVVVRLGLPHTDDPTGGSFDRGFWSRFAPVITSG